MFACHYVRTSIEYCRYVGSPSQRASTLFYSNITLLIIYLPIFTRTASRQILLLQFINGRAARAQGSRPNKRLRKPRSPANIQVRIPGIRIDIECTTKPLQCTNFNAIILRLFGTRSVKRARARSKLAGVLAVRYVLFSNRRLDRIPRICHVRANKVTTTRGNAHLSSYT